MGSNQHPPFHKKLIFWSWMHLSYSNDKKSGLTIQNLTVSNFQVYEMNQKSLCIFPFFYRRPNYNSITLGSVLGKQNKWKNQAFKKFKSLLNPNKSSRMDQTRAKCTTKLITPPPNDVILKIKLCIKNYIDLISLRLQKSPQIILDWKSKK